MSRFVRDPDETFSDARRRSLFGLRVFGFLAWVVASMGVAVATVVVAEDATATLAAIGLIVIFGLVVQLLLWRAERRLAKEQHRMQNLWLARRAELQELAGRDELTQLQNRRFFYEQMQQELDLAARYKRSLSILMLDVDDLKLINDEFGHQTGDVVLRAFGRLLNTAAGERNITARIGGDEFAVILPGADRRNADKLAWKIWEELARQPICETEHASIFLGVSIGTGGFPWGGNDLDEIIHWADTKLYANKLERKGFKNQRDRRNDKLMVGAVVEVLSSALDVRDRMTHRHSRRVARMAAFVARELQLPDEQIIDIEHAASLHDIGKIGVADHILRKTDPLEPEEWQEMKRHSELGYQILNGIDFLHDAAEIVFAHHERFDGRGYPRGLRGAEIPLGARVFAVVDAYDAMTSRRPYREALSQEDALEELMRNSGTQFDPDVVSAFLKMVRTNPDGFRDEGEEFGSRVIHDGSDHHLSREEAEARLRAIDAA